MYPFLTFFLVLVTSALTAETIELNPDRSKIDIAKKIEYLIPPPKDSNINIVLKEGNSWKPNENGTVHFPDEKNPLWLRFSVDHTGKTPHTYYLLFSSPVIDRFEMYYFANGRWVTLASGDQTLRREKPLYSHLPAFPITLNPQEIRTIYIKIISENQYFSFISIHNSRSFLTFSKISDLLFSAYFGAGGLMFLYTLLLAYTLRYRQFFFYFFYLTSILLVTLFSTGFIQYIEIGNSNVWKNYLFPVSIYLTSIFGLLFTKEFLELEKYGKKHLRVTLFLIGLSIFILPSILFLNLRAYIEFALTFVSLPIFWGIYLAIYAIFKNPKKIENYLFFFAFGSMLAGAAVNLSTIQGWIKPLSIATFSLPLGSAIEIFLLAVALMIKVSDLRKDNEEKQEIDAQLKVAKRLQKDLLPKHRSHLKGFPIGFRYLPTSDIGGDFVHYLEDEEGFGVFLCDVSGHGIAAAMIASMAKVSLQLWVSELDQPAKAAEKMRLSLLENLSGHFLSAIFLYINPKKKIMKIANAGHPPLILISPSGDTELVNSQGRAITEFIALKLIEVERPLPESGKIVLYTDGVLEARDPNTDELFGEERFLTLIKDNAELDPQSLCDRVVGEVFRFSKYKRADDDITIFSLGLKRITE
ncbi:serine/threonine protein phosphatase [Leptospira ognonensis]|uniref:Serine/threonine protein phosphatase n=1 Tax=Leptospira ognonensis TaxID=2484945 RepID=A0A4R9JZR9_9LEPT|nr:SpoIIE family protein phosphatase [Leptospira ognonensis]TGL57902.1 serine/threonine protein phosphatase [Leptospira ognonensis]